MLLITENIKVDNLKCHGCASTITNHLLKIKGVEKVDVDVEESLVHITHQDILSKKDLLTPLEYLGYPEEETTTQLQKMKSYVSCAVGKIG